MSGSAPTSNRATGVKFPRPPVLACPKVVESAPLRLPGGRISRDRLAALLDQLLAAGYRFLDVDDWLAADAGVDRGLLLSFDDGSVDFVDRVVPVLRPRRIPGALFVATSRVGRRMGRRLGLLRAVRPQLSWEDLRGLAGEGIRAQSAAHHPVDLTGLPPEMAFGDLMRSRRELERRLGDPAPLLAYPHMAVDPVVADLAARVGFQVAFGRGRLGGAMDQARIALPSHGDPRGFPPRLDRKARRAAEG
jgi:peptidoglycan/xylan/chitin deacetylase (PgdA/CDA1 family)